MSARINILTLVVVATMGFGCKKDGIVDPGGSTSNLGQIIPMKIGNSWTYSIKEYDSLGVLTSSRSYTRTLSNTVTSYGELWYITGNAYTNRPNGYWTWINYGIDTVYRSLIYKYPAASGEQYSGGYVYSTDGPKTVVSTSEQVTVAAGTFTCYHYRFTYSGGMYADVLLCPNVGEIKGVSYWGNGKIMEIRELQSMTLN